MICIKTIRSHPEKLDNSLIKRGLAPASSIILEQDKTLRAMQTEIDSLRHTLKRSSSSNMTKEQIDINKALGEQISILQAQYNDNEQALHTLLSGLPNIASEDTPNGLTEHDNKIVKTWDPTGISTNKNASTHENVKKTYKPHDTVAKHLFDKEAGTRIAGSRFILLHDKLAKLARVLGFWLLEENTKAGYQETYVPYMMNPNIAYGMGVLPKFSQDLFETTTNHYLIPTAEASLVGMWHEQTIQNLPTRLTALTPCFRSEAGAAGKDTTGMIRMHQFQKVEIVCFVEAEQAEEEHQRLVSHVENLLQKLKLPYQILAMCAGDLGFHAHKKFDIEVYMPGLQRFLEISSCSQCSDFQSRRLKIKNKPLPHTLNGSALPIDRTIAAILENYQTEDGIFVPEVLQSFFGAEKIII